MGEGCKSYVAWVQILCQLLSYDPLRGNGYDLCAGPFVVFEVVVENQVAVRNRYDLLPRSVGVFFGPWGVVVGSGSRGGDNQ